MSASGTRAAIVVDTDVFSADLIIGALLAEPYAPLPAGRSAFISFQTAAEIRYGALARRWGANRLRALEAKLASVEIVPTGPDLVAVHARLRAQARAAGHPIAAKHHNADRWIAATAIRLDLPLVSNDRIFKDVPSLRLETVEQLG